MLVNEWVDTVWNVVNVRPKTLHDYKRLYKRHLMPVIGSMSLDEVDVVVLHQDSDNPLIRTVERTHLFGAFFLGDQFAESSINYISLK